jgi:hypothetical protein
LGIKTSTRRLSFVPEGQPDRSLARSAWESVHRENRPVGNGMMERRYQTSQEVFASRRCAVFLKKARYFASKNRHSNHRIGATPARIRPYPTGRLFRVAVSQALRARLRSDRPSGTKAIRPLKGLRIHKGEYEQSRLGPHPKRPRTIKRRIRIKATTRRMSFVPEGQPDRSLARSAWESVHRENRPVGNGMMERRYQTSQRYWRRGGAPCFSRRLDTSHSKNRHSNHRIGAHAGANQTVPYGTTL